MQKEMLHDLIERYLDDDVSESERQRVDSLIATDSEFRAALEFQRAMHLHLGDPGELRLHAALDDILLAPTPGDSGALERPSPRSKISGWLILGGLLLLVVASIAVWYFGGNRQPVSVEPPPAQQPIQTAPTEPIAQTAPAPTKNPPEDLPKRPIAMANPEDFAPNPTLEARIGNIRGDGGIEVNLDSPAAEAGFVLKNGRITLPVKGTMNADSPAVRLPIRLLIYSNRPKDLNNKQARFNLPFPFEATGAEQYRVDFQQQLRLRPGLYYVVIGQQRSLETADGYQTLWVGKFTTRTGK